MSSFLDDLLQETPDGKREAVRAKLRVAVTEALLLQMEKANVSKAALAAMIGVTRSAITQALAGRNLSLNTLADMSNALGLVPSISFEGFTPNVYMRHASALRAGNVFIYDSKAQKSLSVVSVADRPSQPYRTIWQNEQYAEEKLVPVGKGRTRTPNRPILVS